jgi:hypothetical protein
MKTLTTIAFVMTATTAFATDYELHFNQSQSHCNQAANFLKSNINQNLNVQCHQTTSGGGSSVVDTDTRVDQIILSTDNKLIVNVKNKNGAATKTFNVDMSQLAGQDGTNGTNGTDGTNGQDGAKGDKGDTGLTGATGAQGIQGVKGDKGEKGDTGLTGATGQTGQTGLAGAAGAAGTNGTNGTDGTDGTDGVDGTDGTSGIDGDKGKQGIKGKDAISGLSLLSALNSIQGDGVGFGISKEEGSDFTFSTAVKFEIDNRTNVNIGITITEDGRKAASAGIGFSF